MPSPDVQTLNLVPAFSDSPAVRMNEGNFFRRFFFAVRKVLLNADLDPQAASLDNEIENSC